MANLITLSRLPLLVGVVLLLTLGGPWVHIVTVPIVLILILMDTLDGIVARRRREVGLVGSKLDIAVDRTVELVMWVTYTALDVIPLAIPIIFIIRGMLVDTVRSFGVAKGTTPFGMMQTKWGQRLVASSTMRTLYGVAKATAFCLLALGLGLRDLWAGTRLEGLAEGAQSAALITSWIATAICLIRGLPVLIEAPAFLDSLKADLARPSSQESNPQGCQADPQGCQATREPAVKNQ